MKEHQGECCFLWYEHTQGDRQTPTHTHQFLWELPLPQIFLRNSPWVSSTAARPLRQSNRSREQEPSINTRQLKNPKLIQAIKLPLSFSFATSCWQIECHPSHPCQFLCWLIYCKRRCLKKWVENKSRMNKSPWQWIKNKSLGVCGRQNNNPEFWKYLVTRCSATIWLCTISSIGKHNGH